MIYTNENEDWFRPACYTANGVYKAYFVHMILEKAMPPSSFYCKSNVVNNVPAVNDVPANGYAYSEYLQGYPRTIQYNKTLVGFFYQGGNVLETALPHKIIQVKEPSRTVLAYCCVAETASTYARNGYLDARYMESYAKNIATRYAVPTHGNNYNIVFCDGHALAVTPQTYRSDYKVEFNVLPSSL